ncbi:serine/threonine-protein kinase Sgk2 [Trichoderma compactum]
MTLSEQHIEVISHHPLNDLLNHLQVKFRDVPDDGPRQEDVGFALSILIGSTAAFNLALPDGSNVATKLLSILQQVRGAGGEGLGLVLFRPLIHHIVEKSPDEAIWTEVFNIVDIFGQVTPPVSRINPTFNGTPVKSSSSRLADSETRAIVEGELFEEIKNCTFRNVGGFWDKFFDTKGWCEAHKKMLQGIMAEHDGKRWTSFPPVTDEKPVWDWLRHLQDRFLAEAPHKLHTTTSANQFKERKGQMDLFFRTPAAAADGTLEYKDVLVVGEQKKSYDSGRFKADLLQLSRYVRSVFADLPTRRFVHAFTLCASTMELSGPFDIHDEPDKIARAIVGYNTFINRLHGHKHVTLDDSNGVDTRIRLGRLIVRQKAIVCRGTTCFETRNGQVAKFSWVPDKRKPEVETLKLAEERGVQGVARVVAYRRITTVAELREGLQFPDRHRFRNEEKRKSGSDHTSGNSSNSKRLCFSSARLKHHTAVSNQLSVDKSKSNLHTPGEDLWENRIYSCLVISPAGRVIGSFNTVKELLESLRDAIKAHQSLYTTGNILHRDISPNNIIITKPKAEDGFKGMLIDLDLAKVRDSGASRAQYQTGTMQFMAIEVLRNVDHTYRHDLESFFYVLIWMCGRESWTRPFTLREQPPNSSRLRLWEIGSFSAIADHKAYHMTRDGIDLIMREFPAALNIVKPLCLKIRKILFPSDAEGRLNQGTPVGDPDQLYRPIIDAYDATIRCL